MLHIESLDTDTALKNILASQAIQPAEIIEASELSDRIGIDVVLVSDLHQASGSFKERGAENFFATHLAIDGLTFAVTSSAGNHGAGVAYAGRRHGVRTQVHVPVGTPLAKIENIKRLGGDNTTVVVQGSSFEEATEIAQQVVANAHDDTTKYVSAFDDEYVAAGQGTMLYDAKTDDFVQADGYLAQVGGGGLLSGLISATQRYFPRYYGVEVNGATALQTNMAVPGSKLKTVDTFAEGLAVKQVGSIVLDHVHALGDHFNHVAVTPKEVMQALTYLHEDPDNLRRHRANKQPLRAETAGATALAGLFRLAPGLQGMRVAVPITGGNYDQNRLDGYKQTLLSA
jgi:threonine dehydratase